MNPLAKIFLASGILLAGLIYYSLTGPALIPIALTGWGGIWLLISIIQYARRNP